MAPSNYESQWPRAVIFDLDGVLVDSFAVMREAFGHAYAEVVGGTEAPFEEYAKHLGRYFPEIMRIMGLPAEMEGPFIRESNRLAGDVLVYPGVRGMLAALRTLRVRTAVATGKHGERARSLLRRHGLLDSLDVVVGSDEVARPKPHPDIVQRCLQLLAVPPSAAVMIGDAVTDMRSARAAGVTAAAAIWGESDEKALRAEGPDLVLHEPDQVRLVCGWGQRLGCGAGAQQSFHEATLATVRSKSRSSVPAAARPAPAWARGRS